MEEAITTSPENDEEKDSGDEDQPLDWSKLNPKSTKTSRSIPKRGEKSFEPTVEGASGYQQFTLNRAREAMYEALSAPRELQTKRLSQAVWMSQCARARVIDSRGTVLQGIGYTTRRSISTRKHLELLPEEALYMVERGSMLCWKELGEPLQDDTSDPIKLLGAPMSVQQAFTEMLGVEDLTMEHYQVYAYFKRFGYTVRRCLPLQTSPDYIVYPHQPVRALKIKILWDKLTSWFIYPFSKRYNWWTRFHRTSWFPSLLHHDIHYPSIFRSFRFIQSNRHVDAIVNPTKSPYHAFFHVWKPETNWSKQNIPRPDFEVVVINARTTPLPTLLEISNLFDSMPDNPFDQRSKKAVGINQPKSTSLISWLTSLFLSIFKAKEVFKPNPFMILKTGKKNVVLAVVESGTTSMYRFSQGCFEEWPMI